MLQNTHWCSAVHDVLLAAVASALHRVAAACTGCRSASVARTCVVCARSRLRSAYDSGRGMGAQACGCAVNGASALAPANSAHVDVLHVPEVGRAQRHWLCAGAGLRAAHRELRTCTKALTGATATLANRAAPVRTQHQAIGVNGRAGVYAWRKQAQDGGEKNDGLELTVRGEGRHAKRDHQ